SDRADTPYTVFERLLLHGDTIVLDTRPQSESLQIQHFGSDAAAGKWVAPVNETAESRNFLQAFRDALTIYAQYRSRKAGREITAEELEKTLASDLYRRGFEMEIRREDHDHLETDPWGPWPVIVVPGRLMPERWDSAV